MITSDNTTVGRFKGAVKCPSETCNMWIRPVPPGEVSGHAWCCPGRKVSCPFPECEDSYKAEMVAVDLVEHLSDKHEAVLMDGTVPSGTCVWTAAGMDKGWEGRTILTCLIEHKATTCDPGKGKVYLVKAKLEGADQETQIAVCITEDTNKVYAHTTVLNGPWFDTLEGVGERDMVEMKCGTAGSRATTSFEGSVKSCTAKYWSDTVDRDSALEEAAYFAVRSLADDEKVRVRVELREARPFLGLQAPTRRIIELDSDGDEQSDTDNGEIWEQWPSPA